METMRFIHMSDIHYKKSYKDYGFEELIAARRRPEENIRKCIETETADGIDFLLITGDLTHEGGLSDCEALESFLKEVSGEIPYIVLPGNHDKREAFCPVFWKEPGCESGMVYDIGGLRIIALDTGRSVNGGIGQEAVNWLRELLRISAPKGTLLALHHPLIDGQDKLPCAEYDREFIDVISNSDILGIFCGHTHHNFIAQFAGKPYFTADSMAFSMTTKGDDLIFEDHAGYTVMELKGNILSAQVKQTVPEISVTASFSSDKLSQLFSQ